MMMAQVSLYQQVILTTQNYLGPAAERFVDRQIETHLQKRPASLTKNDLIKLIDWIKISISMLTEDSDVVDDFTQSLHKLTR